MADDGRPVAVLYEVECTLDPAITAEFDAWLPDHVEQVLGCPGFLGARMLQHQDAEGVAPIRRVVYRLESRAALEDYLRNDAARLRADAIQRFGDRARFARHVLAPLGAGVVEPRPPQACLNCGAAVRGAYCASCGQRRDVHLKSVAEVLHDFTHSVTHLDSRAWSTLRLLVAKPGALTLEYLRGRLASYLPPFRLYLVVSVMFFALEAIIPGSDPSAAQVVTVSDPDTRAILVRELQAAMVRVEADPAASPQDRRAARDLYERAARRHKACDVTLVLPFIGDAGPRASEACRRMVADGGKRFKEVFRSTAPKLMFVFMPLVAAFALLLYWRPRRPYAEHLVFYLHGHALLFLALSLVTIASGLEVLLPAAGTPLGFVGLAALVWLLWYYYRAMRNVYGQGRWLTIAKFAVLSCVYFLLLSVTMLAGVVFAALSV